MGVVSGKRPKRSCSRTSRRVFQAPGGLGFEASVQKQQFEWGPGHWRGMPNKRTFFLLYRQGDLAIKGELALEKFQRGDVISFLGGAGRSSGWGTPTPSVFF